MELDGEVGGAEDGWRSLLKWDWIIWILWREDISRVSCVFVKGPDALSLSMTFGVMDCVQCPWSMDKCIVFVYTAYCLSSALCVCCYCVCDMVYLFSLF